MVGHSHLLAAKHLRSCFWWYIVVDSHLLLPNFCKLRSDIHIFLQPNISAPVFDDVWSENPTFSYPLFANYSWAFTPSCSQTLPLPLLMIYSWALAPFITRFLRTMVGHSHLLAAKHLRSRFWWYIVGHSYLLLPTFCKLWSDIHTFLQPNTSGPAFDDVWSEIPTFSYQLFANYGRALTPSCSQTPLLLRLMIYSWACAPFINHYLKTMVGHSHLAAKHLRSRFWWYIVGNLHLLLPTFCKLRSDIHTFLQPNTSAPAFDDM